MKLNPTYMLVALGLTAALGYFAGSQDAPIVEGETAHIPHAPAEAAVDEIWTCSMDPQVRLPEFGSCPICGMDLILAASGGSDELLPVLTMNESAMERARIQTALVERRSLAHEVTLVGRVALDETRVATVTSWVEGRLDRLYVDYTGTRLRKGDHVAEIYSPTLYSAQEELLQAVAADRSARERGLDLLQQSSARTLASARERLLLFGLDEAQVDAVITAGKARKQMTLRAQMDGIVIHKAALEGMFVKAGDEIVQIADLDRVWIQLDAYESDLAWIRFGQQVTFSVEAFPGEQFEARVAFIDAVVNPKTHTIGVRLNVENKDHRLKPDMFVTAVVDADLSAGGKVVDPGMQGHFMCPMHPEIHGPEDGACSICGMQKIAVEELGFQVPDGTVLPLAVPDTAPLFTGKRSIVYVLLADHDEPTFEGREVRLGAHAAGWYAVLEGLEEGDEVVVNGNFKIDSELQIRARPSMMSPAQDMQPKLDMGQPMQPEIEPEPESGMTPVVVEDQGPIDEVFRAGLGGLVDSHLAFSSMLTQDEFDPELARAVVQALGSIESSGLDDVRMERWMELGGELRAALQALTASEDIASARAALEPLSAVMVQAVERFGLADGADSNLSVFNCPMAFGGRGADWLGSGAKVMNPYYGESMLHCGSVVREVNAAGQQ